MLCCILLTSCVFAGLVVDVVVLCCEFEKGCQWTVTVTKKELRSRRSRRRHTGLGRLTDPSVWRHWKHCTTVPLYSYSKWAWVLGYIAPRLPNSTEYLGTSWESGTPFTNTTMGEVEYINGILTMERWATCSDAQFLTHIAIHLHVYPRRTVPKPRLTGAPVRAVGAWLQVCRYPPRPALGIASRLVGPMSLEPPHQSAD